MHFAFKRSSVASHGAALAAGAVLALLAAPLWREALMSLNQDRYGQLVEHCDTAMREHHQARTLAEASPGEEARRAMQAGEIGLIVCQDYDIYQKWLMQWGLRENELARMRLEAIEDRAIDLEEVVATHEIRF